MICIYVLKCPLSGRPRYVGKTQTPKTRLASHISKAKSGQTHHHCARWIRQLLEQGMKPEFEIVFHVPPDEEWHTHEKRVIEELKLAGFELTNLTGGGGGFYKPDPELLERRGNALRAQRQVPENKAKFQAIMKAAQSTPAARAAHSLGKRLAWQDSEKRASMLAAMNTPDAKRRRSDAAKRKYADPAFAAIHRERMRLLSKKPERLAQIRAAQDARWVPHRARSAERRAALEIVRQENYARFLVEQAERLRQRWQDEEQREKMQSARWSDEKRSSQASAIVDPARQAKIKQALTPEVIARRNAAIKESWARRKAQAA